MNGFFQASLRMTAKCNQNPIVIILAVFAFNGHVFAPEEARVCPSEGKKLPVKGNMRGAFVLLGCGGAFCG